METTKVITPYFENGVFAGVRVTLGDEDFVIAKKDYQNGKEMTWQEAMDALKADNLETWNYRQICLTMAYHKEINEMLIINGGADLRRDYLICKEVGDYAALYYDGFYGFLYWLRKSEDGSSIRAIKNLKK